MKNNLSDNISNSTFQNRKPRSNCFLLNDTSKSEIKDAKLIDVLSLGESSCILRIPKKICSQGHSLSVYFLLLEAPTVIKRFPTDGEIEHTLRVLTKVMKIEEESEDKVIVELQFQQFSKPQWEAFVAQFTEVQNQIFQEFSKIKGEE